jgi:rod shape-determining protein MreD
VNTKRIALAITVALILQMGLASLSVLNGGGIDLVLVAVVALALGNGPIVGLLVGAIGGMMQDALGGGIIGIGGISKTLIGFFVGSLSVQLMVVGLAPKFLVFLGASQLNSLFFIGLYLLLGLPMPAFSFVAIAGHAIVNGVVGVVWISVIEMVQKRVLRQRERYKFRRRFGTW